MRKKVDERIRTLIENGVKLRHRSLFLMIGDKSRHQIPNLNLMLKHASLKPSRKILWCYKDELEISSHKQKQKKQVKKMIDRGLLDPELADNYTLFLATTDITYCHYKDSKRILGRTFSMCILQDFEALTPNVLARTIETVEGGGLIILMLRSLPSLTSLYTMVMDVHQRFRTESHTQVTARFNERLLLSLASRKSCIVMDDELNILPISSHVRSIQPVSLSEDLEGLSERERELQDLKEQLREAFPMGQLIGKCCTMDQATGVISFLDAIFDKTLRGTVALLAARGRGKSAALGLSIAGAVATGYSSIFVTAPSPENLKTLFEFVCKGLNALDYKEHLHYVVIQSKDPEMKKATVKIDIRKQHRQRYIRPSEQAKHAITQANLLVIDEAAAIPLPIVKSMLGPYLVFLSSTVNGYEGTGRSLLLKLLEQLQSQTTSANSSNSGRIFKKIELNESIRYAPGDPIESWLNGLLCLDVAKHIPHISRLPDPKKCDLYYVNRDALFSYHKEAELLLQRMMALYVASHYKNSPDDLQLMADAPAHHLFVLLGPVDETKNVLPDILCVIQMKYGTEAVKKLTEYYEGKMTHFAEEDKEGLEEPQTGLTEAAEKSDVTGEHTCMVLKEISSNGIEVPEPSQYFRQRFRSLLGPCFQKLHCKLAMSIIAPKRKFTDRTPGPSDDEKRQQEKLLSPYDMERLEDYTNNMVDFPVIMDLVPRLAHEYFQEKIPVTLTAVQATILLCMGLQNKDLTSIKDEMEEERVTRESILSDFRKVMKILYKYLKNVASKQTAATTPRLKQIELAPHSRSVDEDHSRSVDEDLEEGAREVMVHKYLNYLNFKTKFITKFSRFYETKG
ncbi:hypothetical protein LUZ60_008615 [Juncus effusus]|nr:hypothetical protein LUZ60_008615 [Juncus effusus]